MQALPETYQFTTEPYAHQTEALRCAQGREAFAYLMEMRTGKTKVVIDEAAAMVRERKIDTLVVIAPKGVHVEWLRQIAEHGPSETEQQWFLHAWEGGTTKREEYALDALVHCQRSVELPNPFLRVLTINWDAVSTAKGKRAVNRVLSASGLGTLVVVDEAHRMKSPQAQRTKAVLKLAGMADYRRILTGTPVANNPLDIWAPFAFLDPSVLGNNYWVFRSRYAILRERRIPNRPAFKEITGWQHLDELKAKIAAHSYSITAAECLDLPPRVYRTLSVELAPVQRRVYDDVCRDLVSELGEQTMSTPLAITALLRLQQIIGGFFISDGARSSHDLMDGEPTPRDKALLSFLEDVPAPEKVIIWTRFVAERNKIVALLEDVFGVESVACVHADIGQLSMERFKEDPACRFLVANPDGGAGEGRDFSVASVMLYYSNSFKLTTRLQSEARCDRKGRTGHVLVVDLETILPDGKPAVDKRILEALKAKRDLANGFTGEELRRWVGGA